MTSFENYYNSITYSIESQDIVDFKSLISQVHLYKNIDKKLLRTDFGSHRTPSKKDFISDLFQLSFVHEAFNITEWLLDTDFDFEISVVNLFQFSSRIPKTLKEKLFINKRVSGGHVVLGRLVSMFKEIELGRLLIQNPHYDNYFDDFGMIEGLVYEEQHELIEELLKLDPVNEYKTIKYLKDNKPDLLSMFDKYNKQYNITVNF